jgi:L-histidine Nalpha-methyltransferase / hercynylcysteine S-oxide synthase
MSSRIIDIRLNDKTSNDEADLHEEIVKGLSGPLNQKSLPTVLLHDEEGLRIFDEITTDADEYYLYAAEENLLKNHAHDIVQVMYKRHEGGPVEGVILELGAG